MVGVGCWTIGWGFSSFYPDMHLSVILWIKYFFVYFFLYFSPILFYTFSLYEDCFFYFYMLFLFDFEFVWIVFFMIVCCTRIKYIVFFVESFSLKIWNRFHSKSWDVQFEKLGIYFTQNLESFSLKIRESKILKIRVMVGFKRCKKLWCYLFVVFIESYEV